MLGLAHIFLGPPILADGYKYEEYASELPVVSALAFDGGGDLYATLEESHEQGRLVLIRDGHQSEILGHLDKPDGILVRGSTLYITTEAGDHGIAVYESDALRYLEGVSAAEGIASAGAVDILVVEDRKHDGRLLRVNTETGRIEVLLGGLKQPEGVCQSPDGEIYYVEKGLDRLSRYSGGEVATAATGLDKPAFLNCLQDGSILITEDRTNFGRLLHFGDGKMTVLARHLRSPQSVIVGSDGAYYLAEQRRNRILKIHGP